MPCRAALAVLSLLVLAGCDDQVCTRHSDCAPGQTCGAFGLCGPPWPSDAGWSEVDADDLPTVVDAGDAAPPPDARRPPDAGPPDAQPNNAVDTNPPATMPPGPPPDAAPPPGIFDPDPPASWPADAAPPPDATPPPPRPDAAPPPPDARPDDRPPLCCSVGGRDPGVP